MISRQELGGDLLHSGAVGVLEGALDGVDGGADGNTAKAAAAMQAILEGRGCPKVVAVDLCRVDQAKAVEDAFRYGKIFSR